jgi:hypothetical protein
MPKDITRFASILIASTLSTSALAGECTLNNPYDEPLSIQLFNQTNTATTGTYVKTVKVLRKSQVKIQTPEDRFCYRLVKQDKTESGDQCWNCAGDHHPFDIKWVPRK